MANDTIIPSTGETRLVVRRIEGFRFYPVSIERQTKDGAISLEGVTLADEDIPAVIRALGGVPS